MFVGIRKVRVFVYVYLEVVPSSRISHLAVADNYRGLAFCIKCKFLTDSCIETK